MASYSELLVLVAKWKNKKRRLSAIQRLPAPAAVAVEQQVAAQDDHNAGDDDVKDDDDDEQQKQQQQPKEACENHEAYAAKDVKGGRDEHRRMAVPNIVITTATTTSSSSSSLSPPSLTTAAIPILPIASADVLSAPSPPLNAAEPGLRQRASRYLAQWPTITSCSSSSSTARSTANAALCKDVMSPPSPPSPPPRIKKKPVPGSQHHRRHDRTTSSSHIAAASPPPLRSPPPPPTRTITTTTTTTHQQPQQQSRFVFLDDEKIVIDDFLVVNPPDPRQDHDHEHHHNHDDYDDVPQHGSTMGTTPGTNARLQKRPSMMGRQSSSKHQSSTAIRPSSIVSPNLLTPPVSPPATSPRESSSAGSSGRFSVAHRPSASSSPSTTPRLPRRTSTAPLPTAAPCSLSPDLAGQMSAASPRVPNSPRGPPPSPRTTKQNPPKARNRLSFVPRSRPTSMLEAGGDKTSRRKSWLPSTSGRLRGRKASHGEQELEPPMSAWINAGESKIDYNLAFLLQGERVPELWNESGDMLVYLFPRHLGYGPSFRVPSIMIASSKKLISKIENDPMGRMRGRASTEHMLTADGAARYYKVRGASSPQSPSPGPDQQSTSDGSADSIRSFAEGPRETSLYFPVDLSNDGSSLSEQDIQTLVNVRNLFAFFAHQPLVGTPTHPSVVRILLSIAACLKKFEFTNIDGSTFGEAAVTAFSFYIDDFDLADCTQSREKTIESVILGESMRSQELYNEAFAHAVGKYTALTNLRSPLFSMMSQNTRNRLERASLDLSLRQKSIFVRLNDFEFPSLFAGFANSTSSSESKIIRFKAWRASYLNLRRAVLHYYKDLHGQWPPKASSKKNNFVEGGLNRLVLKGLYADLCALYDLLADRDSLTTRSYDAGGDDESDDANANAKAKALRRILSEYDRASPPVQPPVPFDIPRVPTMATIEPKHMFASPKDQHKAASRKLQSYETLLLLTKSHNLDSDLQLPFLQMFKNFEKKEAKGCSARELEDQRYGYWLFMYAALQALPMLVVDAPNLRFTSNVEYFLCNPPLGNLPWMEDAAGPKKAWYGIQGGQGVVSLPSDVVNHGVEAIYRRSHCWIRAEEWISAAENDPISSAATAHDMIDAPMSPLEPPPGFTGNGGGGAELGSPSGMSSALSSSRYSSTESLARGSSTLAPAERQRRSRSKNDQRKSIALGLEQLPIPQGMDMGMGVSPPWAAAQSTPVSMGGFSSSRNASRAGSPSRLASSSSAAAAGARVSSWGSASQLAGSSSPPPPLPPPSNVFDPSIGGNGPLTPPIYVNAPGNRGSTFELILGDEFGEVHGSRSGR